MPYVERTDEELIAVWERFVAVHPDPREIAVRLSDGTVLDGNGLIAALRQGHHELWQNFIQPLRKLAEALDEDPAAAFPSPDDALTLELKEQLVVATGAFTHPGTIVVSSDIVREFSLASRLTILSTATPFTSIRLQGMPDGSLEITFAYKDS